MSIRRPCRPPRNRQKAGGYAGFSFLSTVKPQRRHGGVARAATRERGSRKPVSSSGADGIICQKRKTRPGGQPDGSSHMGALGVDGRSRRIQPRWGGITAPTVIVSRQGRQHVQTDFGIFFNFLAGGFGRKTTARRADRPRQRPTCRTPWRQAVGSGRESGALLPVRRQFPRQVGPKPWLRAPPARRLSPKPPQRRRLRRRRTGRRVRGLPRSRAVLIKIARTSSGFKAGLRSSISAARPLI